ncbi:hypothetical protein ALC57_14583 [Trachymyrmex cornetzi]|uniref:Uncharacterized protein n=1 Tax=Trachymyrmex cornetzi TaxID=471704 RepID=A0A151IY72_9HYME|nr:hypothetical protein ALC57_14583 [Trachymyrmex cornetzi]
MLVDSETMTLERALAPLMTIGGFCNLTMFEYPLGQPRTYISYLYGLIKWSLLMYFYYYPRYINNLQNKTIVISDIISLLNIILILISICRFKELKTCLRELAIVDHTLEALGTPKEYQRLHNWIIRIIIGWIVYVFYHLTYYKVFSFFFHRSIPWYTWNVMLEMFLGNYPSDVFILSALIFAAILGLVLYICVHLICKLFLLILFVKMFTEKHLKTFW